MEELRRHELELRELIFRAENSIAHHIFTLRHIHDRLAASDEQPFPYWRSKFSPRGDNDALEMLRPFLHFEK